MNVRRSTSVSLTPSLPVGAFVGDGVPPLSIVVPIGDGFEFTGNGVGVVGFGFVGVGLTAAGVGGFGVGLTGAAVGLAGAGVGGFGVGTTGAGVGAPVGHACVLQFCDSDSVGQSGALAMIVRDLSRNERGQQNQQPERKNQMSRHIRPTVIACQIRRSLCKCSKSPTCQQNNCTADCCTRCPKGKVKYIVNYVRT